MRRHPWLASMTAARTQTQQQCQQQQQQCQQQQQQQHHHHHHRLVHYQKKQCQQQHHHHQHHHLVHYQKQQQQDLCHTLPGSTSNNRDCNSYKKCTSWGSSSDPNKDSSHRRLKESSRGSSSDLAAAPAKAFLRQQCHSDLAAARAKGFLKQQCRGELRAGGHDGHRCAFVCLGVMGVGGTGVGVMGVGGMGVGVMGVGVGS